VYFKNKSSKKNYLVRDWLLFFGNLGSKVAWRCPLGFEHLNPAWCHDHAAMATPFFTRSYCFWVRHKEVTLRSRGKKTSRVVFFQGPLIEHQINFAKSNAYLIRKYIWWLNNYLSNKIVNPSISNEPKMPSCIYSGCHVQLSK